MLPDISQPEFWNAAYLQKQPPRWDIGHVAPPIARMVVEGAVPPGRVMVLGAGLGHDAIHLARSSFAVTTVDFAPAAAQSLRKRVAELGLPIEVLEEDLFQLPARGLGPFDAVLEHTCFSAIDPRRRAEYVEAVHALLGPGGHLFGLFFAHGRSGGPPFSCDEDELRRLFTPRFELLRLQRAPDSVESRASQELEFLFRRR
jgi:SAM-dependent methyltransferase